MRANLPEVPPPEPPRPPRPQLPDWPVPGTPARTPLPEVGTPGPQTLEERLHAHRIVLLTGALDDERATRVAAELLTLDAESAAPVTLRLDCEEGEAGAALVLLDALDSMRAPVHAVVTGRLGGAAVVVLAAVTRRAITPHARIRLAEPTFPPASGDPARVAAQAAEQQRLADAIVDRLARLTGRDTEQLAAVVRAGRWLSAEEAVEWGLVEEVQGR